MEFLPKFKIIIYYLEIAILKFQFDKINTFTFHYHCHQDRQKNLINLPSVKYVQPNSKVFLKRMNLEDLVKWGVEGRGYFFSVRKDLFCSIFSTIGCVICDAEKTVREFREMGES